MLKGYVVISREVSPTVRVTSFGSGSSGNAILVQSGDGSVLVDVGVPVRRLRQGLAAAGVAPERLSAVLISHEHWDHVRSLGAFSHSLSCPILATTGTARALGDQARAWERLDPEATLHIGSLAITALRVPHDAEEPVGFLVEDGESTVSIFTDLGEPPPYLSAAIGRSQLVVLEANYDATMLARGRYPEHLKRRIRGPFGHLSNDDCGAFLSGCLNGATHDVWLAHLSENNNRPSLATATVARHLSAPALALTIGPLPRHGRDVVWDSAAARARPRQVGLPL